MDHDHASAAATRRAPCDESPDLLMAGHGPVAYILKGYPRLTETFIIREIRGMERRGMDLRLFVLSETAEAHQEVVQREVRDIHSPVVYLDRANWRAPRARLANQIWLLRRRPLRWLRVWAYVLLKRRHRLTIDRLLVACRLVELIDGQQIRWLHAHFAHGPASVADFVHLLTGLPYSFSAHAKDVYVSSPAVLARKLQRCVFVTTCTAEARDHLRELAHSGPDGARCAGKVHLAYHGVDVRRFAPAPELPADQADVPARPLILSIGRLVEKKGFATLLDACALLAGDSVPFSCAIYGTGPLREALERQIAQLGLRDHVHLRGACAHDALPAIYRSAGVFALAPHTAADGDRDGIPNVLLEAMASGLPVVATATRAIAELITDGRDGLLVPEHDSPALALALRRLLGDASLRACLGTQARRHMVADFDDARALDELAGRFLAAGTEAATGRHAGWSSR